MLRAAIYGLGTWGNRLAEAVKGSESIRFVKGVTRSPDKHRDFSAKYSIPLVDSYAQVLADPAIDAVVLATPHSMHCEQVVQAAQAGKHVYVEKPIALTRATAQKAVDAARAAGITLGLGFNRRYAPAFVEMIKRIRAGEIGDIVHVEGQHSGPTGYKLKADSWRSTRAEAPAGGMTARGIHSLDSMIQIAGLVSEVYAHSDKRKMAADIDMDDTTSMLLKFTGGATGYLATVFVTAELFRVHAFGTKGWLEMRGDNELTSCTLEGPPSRVALPAINKEKAILEAFAAAVAAKRPYMVPPDEAVNGIAVLEAIVASAGSGRPVAIP